MDKITAMSTFDQIHDILGPSGCADYLVPAFGEQGKPMSITPMTAFEQYGWSPEGMAEGFTRLQELTTSGKKVFYPLWDEKEAEENPALKERYLVHFPVEKKTPFLLISCGGAYIGAASMIEGFPTCKEINDLGYHVFTLNYRASANAKFPNPIEDMAVAVKFILEHAEELNVDVENYAVGGFSAGGHLAACFGSEELGWKKYHLPKPVVEILAYPVITMQEYTHADSRKNFLQEYAEDKEMQKKYSAEEQVTENYPATYVWQCDKDYAVPIENTQMLTAALEKCGVPFKYETFDSNMHGWGSAKGTIAEGWTKNAVAFWQENMK